MVFLDTKSADFESGFAKLLRRAETDTDAVEPVVKEILAQVRAKGEAAVLEQVRRFDGWNAGSFSELCFSEQDLKKAYDATPSDVQRSLHVAHERITRFHQKQVQNSWLSFESGGEILGQKISAVARAGLYIPGGKASYPSSVLMNAIPAVVAGVNEIAMCVPTPRGEVNQLVLAAAWLCGVREVYRIGGASAIGAMAYGTEHIKKCDVITGPGNIFVATAKKMVFGTVNIDMVAGPSEIGILADESANATYIAIDMLAQAEHDQMASSILITPSSALAKEVAQLVAKHVQTLPRREIAAASVENRGAIIVTRDKNEALDLMNRIAPEHLEILFAEPFSYLAGVKNAGAIFLGELSPEAIGDYIAGPNHTLPTGSSAKFFSPLSVDNFMKKTSIISMNAKTFASVAPHAAALASGEGLQAHKQSLDVRLEDLNRS
ncbi:MAG: histidinol dehydrogenase [Helicobacteraceae bacterium]